MNRLSIIALVLATANPQLVLSDEGADRLSADQVAFFESNIRPLLVKHCYECHSDESGVAESGLRLDTRQAIRHGGDRGPAIVPGDTESSLLLQAIAHSDADLKMPPRKARLPDRAIADIRRWIAMGAPDPRVEAAGSSSAAAIRDGEFWAYRAAVQAATPEVGDTRWPRGTLDRFILSKLETSGLEPSPDAAPHVLLRRLHFDLVGLPPSPKESERFVRSSAELGIEPALAREVDRLLESKAYGERWGRHWLDVARYAESSGKEANISFPYAWRYRDYVIDCFNEDVPLERFITEQLAGDLLPASNDRERARLLIATGFLAIGLKNLDEANEQQFAADLVDEQIDAVTRVFMASSIACARCHDHKFDPFSMEDYYALAGVFASTKTFFGTAVAPANRVGGDPLVLPKIEEVPILHASISSKKVEALKQEHAALMAQKAAGVKSLTDALRIFWRSGAIEGQLEKVDDQGRALPLGMGVAEAQTIADAPLLMRGEVARPGKMVARRTPQAIPVPADIDIPSDQSGRLQLAEWITHPEHPLTSRVHVNRVWLHLFGSGLVPTVDDFGATGKPPSHPQLLDHLALRFVAQGWSTKQLIREIVLSRAYRQASTFREAAYGTDPDNQLLWRMSKRRLEAEAIRDAMLSISGQLDPQRPMGSLVGRVIGDRPISLVGLDKRLPKDLDGSLHRSLYLPVMRDRLPDVLDVFDFAEPSLVTGRRDTTNVPTQALYMLNSEFVWERAAGLADRLAQQASDTESRIELAFQLCYSRPVTQQEKMRSMQFLRTPPDSVERAPDRKWTSFCQALFCAAEFRNLD